MFGTSTLPASRHRTSPHGVVSGYVRLQAAAIVHGETYWGMHRDFTIGRSAEQDVVLDNRSVSRAHAGVQLTRRGWILRDLESTNGTFVNGKRIGKEGCRLATGDMLRIGKVVLFVAELIEGLPEELMLLDGHTFGT